MAGRSVLSWSAVSQDRHLVLHETRKFFPHLGLEVDRIGCPGSILRRQPEAEPVEDHVDTVAEVAAQLVGDEAVDRADMLPERNVLRLIPIGWIILFKRCINVSD